MNDFFAARVEGYDEHMIANVEGCKEGYKKMAELVPEGTETLLDLGCGTGLELEEIFRRFPDVSVTGVDLTREMLDRLAQKFSGKNIVLINDDYFAVDFGANSFDTAVSFQTMHHFEKDRKTELYRKIHGALKDGGVYIECDYMVETQGEEDHWFAENRRIRKEMNISEGEFYHYDTPCTVENQIKMFLSAGFAKAETVFRVGCTTIIVAYKN